LEEAGRPRDEKKVSMAFKRRRISLTLGPLITCYNVVCQVFF